MHADRHSGLATGPKSSPLLAPDEPPAYEILHPEGRSPLFITCDHASRRIPGSLGTLGVSEGELERHIAWDIGAAGVARRLAGHLDAWAILQNYSRLVIDCNRPPSSPHSIAVVSEHTSIPGNVDLDAAARGARVAAIFQPYHRAIASALDARATQRQPTVFVAVHSFTPEYKARWRPWHVGLLFNRDARLATVLQGLFENLPGLVVGMNEPYTVDDETDYGVPVHAERRGLPYIELEIRQDLIRDEAGQTEWAARLACILPLALARLEVPV